MPNRILRDGILTSDAVDSLSPPAELFYRRLMSVVDDFGRFDARPAMLRVSCYPLRVDRVREADISRWLAEVQSAGLVALYAVNAKTYLEMQNFRQQVRAKESKYPARDGPPPGECAADAQHMRSTCTASAHLDGDGDGDGDGVPSEHKRAPARDVSAGKSRKSAKATPKTPIPSHFALSDRVRRWAAEHDHGRLDEHFEHFVGAATAKGYVYADWDQALMNAIRDNWARLANGTGRGYDDNRPRRNPGEDLRSAAGRVRAEVARERAAAEATRADGVAAHGLDVRPPLDVEFRRIGGS